MKQGSPAQYRPNQPAVQTLRKPYKTRTPPDAVTQCLLAAPLLILFEFGIILCRRVDRKQKERDAERDRPAETDIPATDKAG